MSLPHPDHLQLLKRTFGLGASSLHFRPGEPLECVFIPSYGVASDLGTTCPPRKKILSSELMANSTH
eukprot:6488810-Alexandrium_andersonii.AAC.1